MHYFYYWIYVTIFLKCHNGLADPLRKMKKTKIYISTLADQEKSLKNLRKGEDEFYIYPHEFPLLGFTLWIWAKLWIIQNSRLSCLDYVEIICIFTEGCLYLTQFFTKLWQNFLHINQTWKYAIFTYFCNGNLYKLYREVFFNRWM